MSIYFLVNLGSMASTPQTKTFEVNLPSAIFLSSFNWLSKMCCRIAFTALNLSSSFIPVQRHFLSFVTPIKCSASCPLGGKCHRMSRQTLPPLQHCRQAFFSICPQIDPGRRQARVNSSFCSHQLPIRGPDTLNECNRARGFLCS